MTRQHVSASTSTIEPLPQPDERVLVSQEELASSIDRENRAYELFKQMPVPRNAEFIAYLLLRSAEEPIPGLAPLEAIQVAARRELKVWFALRPRRAAIHRRFNTRRWRFARDGSLRG